MRKSNPIPNTLDQAILDHLQRFYKIKGRAYCSVYENRILIQTNALWISLPTRWGNSIFMTFFTSDIKVQIGLTEDYVFIDYSDAEFFNKLYETLNEFGAIRCRLFALGRYVVKLSGAFRC